MLKITLKIIIAIGILYWLILQGKLDLSLGAKFFQNPGYATAGIIFVSIQLFLGAYRLGFLLKTKASYIKGGHLIGAQWVGQLFAAVLPGALTSDLVKVGYIKKMDSSLSKSYILFLILIDRIIGLNSLLFISGMTSLIFFNEIEKINSSMRSIIFINIALFICSLIGMSLLFLKVSHQEIFLKIIPTKKLKNLLVEAWKLKDHKEKFFTAYVISVVGHLFSIGAFWVINILFFEGPIKLEYLATLIPLGHLALVVPISPGGIGVGHAAFATLFHFIGHGNGASLYNVYWMVCLIISMFGVFPFIFYKSNTYEKTTVE